MDAANEESGDSWIFVAENLSVNYGSQEISPENDGNQSEESDTDSISIIGEEEPEEQNEHHAEDTDQLKENANIKQNTISRTLLQPCDEEQSQRDSQEELNADIDLSDGSIKTYVHRNNKSLNTMLNVILLGSVLTATGLAIGHIWGVQDDCTLHANTSITEVLYTLSRLEAENQFLKKKVTEMEKIHLSTMTVNIPDQIVTKKWTTDPIDFKNSDLKVVSEKNKWNHIDDPTIISQMRKAISRDDFEEQINQLNSIYGENKEWLDKEVASRLRREEQVLKLTQSTVTDDGRIVPLEIKTDSVKVKKIPLNDSSKTHSFRKEVNKINGNVVNNGNKILATPFIGPLSLKDYSKQRKANKEYKSGSKHNPSKVTKADKKSNRITLKPITKNEEQNIKFPEKKLYSEALKNPKNKQWTSLKEDENENNIDGITIKDTSVDQKIAEMHKMQFKKSLNYKQKKESNGKNKYIQRKEIKNYNSNDNISIKDHKFESHKHKNNKNNNDRRKSYKKPKNENKYRQWEMNRGYLKNEDSESTASFDEQPKYSGENHYNHKQEIINSVNPYTDNTIKGADFGGESKSIEDESEFNVYKTQMPKRSKEYFRRTQPSRNDWYDNLAIGRKEMRNKRRLASFLTQNKAQWYFERMDNREHCRKQLKNVTKQCPNAHNIKRSMNFKTRR